MDFFGFSLSFLLRTGDGERDELDESLFAGEDFFLGFFSCSDSDSEDDDDDDSEFEADDESEFDFDDRSDGERAGLFGLGASLTGDDFSPFVFTGLFDDVSLDESIVL